MPRCAFLTIANQEGWFIDDDLVHGPLRNLGWEITEVVWNAEVDWDTYDVVVIRSPWDYQQNLLTFLAVLRRIENSSATLFNALEMVEWNIDKHYLFELQRHDIEIVPTLRLDSPSPKEVHNAFRRLGNDQIVLKPTNGANADDTYRVSTKTGESQIVDICEVFSEKRCFVQPFMHGIVSEGEFSLIYFNGQLSHSILKTVQQGDFRVQEEHGGGVVPVTRPDPKLITQANNSIAAIPGMPLYARVDLVRSSLHRFAVMELELIEPCLYFRFAEQSAEAFATAIVDRYLHKTGS